MKNAIEAEQEKDTLVKYSSPATKLVLMELSRNLSYLVLNCRKEATRKPLPAIFIHASHPPLLVYEALQIEILTAALQ